jgi:hypothetical protein
MKNEYLVDIPKLAEHLKEEGACSFQRWAATAHEIARDAYNAIERVRHDYSTLHESELLKFRYESFIGAMLDTMPTLEMKKTLLTAEAIQYKKF